MKLKAGKGVAALEESAVAKLVGHRILKSSEDHGVIDGIPFDIPQNYDLVMHYADKLVGLSEVRLDRWKRET